MTFTDLLTFMAAAAILGLVIGLTLIKLWFIH
jgi:hypothetical protein